MKQKDRVSKFYFLHNEQLVVFFERFLVGFTAFHTFEMKKKMEQTCWIKNRTTQRLQDFHSKDGSQFVERHAK